MPAFILHSRDEAMLSNKEHPFALAGLCFCLLTFVGYCERRRQQHHYDRYKLSLVSSV
jgi:hypothetical protein